MFRGLPTSTIAVLFVLAVLTPDASAWQASASAPTAVGATGASDARIHAEERAQALAWLDSWERQDDATVLAWDTRLRPTDAERSFERIPWLTTFGDGLRASHAQQRPLLLWMMNGHPLGCT